MFVEYRGRHAEVKCNDFNALENGIEKKLGVSLSNHQLDYWHSKRNEWIGIYDDDDLKNVSEDTKVRLILKDSGKIIFDVHGRLKIWPEFLYFKANS